MSKDKVIHIDENDREIGEVFRKEAHQKGLLHRVVVIYVFDVNGNILVQERADGRFDHSSAGHVDPGETYLEAAKRELGEELGIFGVPLEEHGMLLVEEYIPEKGKHKNHLFKMFSCAAMPGNIQAEEVKSVHFEDPISVLAKIREDSSRRVYTGGFAASLPVLVEIIKSRGT
jgi:isopentenyldiphosphate isomerase